MWDQENKDRVENKLITENLTGYEYGMRSEAKDSDIEVVVGVYIMAVQYIAENKGIVTENGYTVFASAALV